MAAETDRTANFRDANSPQVVVWDVLIRTGHWLLVLFFFAAYFMFSYRCRR